MKHNIQCRLQEWMNESDDNITTLSQKTGVGTGVIRRLSKNQFDRVDCYNWQTLCEYYKKDITELFYTNKSIKNAEIEEVEESSVKENDNDSPSQEQGDT